MRQIHDRFTQILSPIPPSGHHRTSPIIINLSVHSAIAREKTPFEQNFSPASHLTTLSPTSHTFATLKNTRHRKNITPSDTVTTR